MVRICGAKGCTKTNDWKTIQTNCFSLSSLGTPGLRTPGLRTPGLRTPGLGTPGLRTPGLQTLILDLYLNKTALNLDPLLERLLAAKKKTNSTYYLNPA